MTFSSIEFFSSNRLPNDGQGVITLFGLYVIIYSVCQVLVINTWTRSFDIIRRYSLEPVNAFQTKWGTTQSTYRTMWDVNVYTEWYGTMYIGKIDTSQYLQPRLCWLDNIKWVLIAKINKRCVLICLNRHKIKVQSS